MNNGTVSDSSSQAYINDVYLATIQVYIGFGCLTILIYASFLHLADEVEYIWKQKFTLPTLLYILAKYPLFFYFPVYFLLELWPQATSSLRLCNDLGLLQQVINIFPFIGVQGMISVRTYSLCRGYRPMFIVLSITFFTALSFYVYESTILDCVPVPLAGFYKLAFIIGNVMVIISDILAFITVIRQIWGLWRLKRGLGLQNNDDLITSILQQGILRFSFVLLISTTELLLVFFATNVADNFAFFQNVLSTILMCEFTLDLRQRNARSISNPSALHVTTLSFRENPVQSVRTVLGRLHESIVAEMGERNKPINNNVGLNLEESDDLPNDLNGVDLDRVEELPVQDT